MTKLNGMAVALIASGIFLANYGISPVSCRAQAAPEDPAPANEESFKADCPSECGPWPERLGLSDEQMEKLITLKSDYEIKFAEKKAQLKADMKQMMLLMTADKVDKDAVLSLNEKMNSLKAELSTARINKMLDGMAVMSTKQKEQIHRHLLVHVLSHHSMPDSMQHHTFIGHHHS